MARCVEARELAAAGPGAVVGACRAAEAERGEHARDDGAQHEEAGADNADVHFGDGVEGGEESVGCEGGIGADTRDGHGVDGVQAEAGCYDGSCVRLACVDGVDGGEG